MSKVNNVADFLDDLATAIKTKKGSSSAINAQDFANEIINLNAGLSSSLNFSQTNNLSQYLTNIADAIRAKKGSSDLIDAQDFAYEVTNLPTEVLPDISELTSTARLAVSGATVTVSIGTGQEAYIADTNNIVHKATDQELLVYEGGSITNPNTGVTTTQKVWAFRSSTTLSFTTNWQRGWGAIAVTVKYLIR